jgi:lipopolysaccharide export system permease protein
MMPTVVSRYIGRQVLLATSFVLLAFLGLFAFFDFLADMDRLLRPGVRFADVAISIALGLPARVYELAPLAALIGSVYTLAGLASSSQFTAMRSAGLTTVTALRIMLRTGLVIVLITVLVGEVVTPLAERASVAMQASNPAISKMGAPLRSGQWVRDSIYEAGQLQKVRFVNFASYQEGKGLMGLSIYEFSPENQMTQWIRATSAVYQGDQRWELQNVELRVFETRGDDSAVTLVAKTLTSYQWSSTLEPDLLSGLYIAPEKMSAIQLWRYQSFLTENQQNIEKVELALAKKTIYPLAVLVMMVIALPFAYLHARAGGVSVKIFIGIMLGIGFYLLNNLFSHLTVVANIAPLVSASVPSVIALIGGLMALWWVNRV